MQSNLSQHIRTNLDLVFERTLNLPNSVDELGEKSFEWLISGAMPNSLSYFHNGLHKIYPVWENQKWRARLAEEVYKLCVDEFKKIDPDVDIKGIVRANINLTVNNGKMFDASIHADNSELDSWVFLVYLLGSSGSTDFNQSLTDPTVVKTVEFEPSKLLIFPACYAHQGHLPVDSSPRFVLNYVVTVETKLRDQILAKSSNTLRKMYVTN